MAKKWYLLVIMCQVHEAFTFIPAGRRYAFQKADGISYTKRVPPRICRMFSEKLDDGKAKPTSDDPSLGVNAAW